MADSPVEDFESLNEAFKVGILQSRSMMETIANSAAVYRDHCISLQFSVETAEAMSLQYYSMLVALAVSAQS